MKKFIFMKLILIYGANFFIYLLFFLFINLNNLLLFLNIFIIKNE